MSEGTKAQGAVRAEPDLPRSSLLAVSFQRPPLKQPLCAHQPRNATSIRKARPMQTTPEIAFQRLIDMAFALSAVSD